MSSVLLRIDGVGGGKSGRGLVFVRIVVLLLWSEGRAGGDGLSRMELLLGLSVLCIT